MVILELQENSSKTIVTAATVYINPTPIRAQHNEKIYQRLLDWVKMSQINQVPFILCGDFNHYSVQLKSDWNKFGLYRSKYAKTRTSTQGKEVDYIASTEELKNQSSDHHEFMSDHLWLKAQVDIRSITTRIRRVSFGYATQTLTQDYLCNILTSVSKWSEVREIITNDAPYSIVNEHRSQPRLSICSKILSGEIPTVTFEDRIRKSLKNEKVGTDTWSIIKSYQMSTKHRKSCIVLGIRLAENTFTWDCTKVSEIVADFYKSKFSEHSDIIQKCDQTIATMSRNLDIKKIITWEDLIQWMRMFKESAYGSDYIALKHLKSDKFRILLSETIHRLITNAQSRIPDEFLTGRLILISKTQSPIVEISKTRPLIVQSLPLRIIEKVIYSKLKAWTKWNNFNLHNYQTGFREGMSTLINQVRVKLEVQRSKKLKKDSSKRPYIFSLDLSGAFDYVPRQLLLEAIKLKVKAWETCMCSEYWTTWTQLLKQRTVYYNEQEIIMHSGVPQGGVLSPMLFNLALDHWLTTCKTTSDLINSQRLFAYADDVIIILKDKTDIIDSIINSLNSYGFKANPAKCGYIGPWENSNLSAHGSFKSSIKYLGIHIGYRKNETLRSIKTSITQNVKLLTKLLRSSSKNKTQFQWAYYKSLLLFYTAPSLIAGEITIKDVANLATQTIRKMHWVPAMVKTSIVQAILAEEWHTDWLIRVLSKMTNKFNSNPQLSQETQLWKCYQAAEVYKSNWLPVNNIQDYSNLLTNCSRSRLILQATANRFYEYDSDKTKATIWPCGFVWNFEHRLKWTTINVRSIALFTPDHFKRYVKNSMFQCDPYRKAWVEAEAQMKLLKKVNKQTASLKLEPFKPCQVKLEDYPSCIRPFIERLRALKDCPMPLIGQEFTLFVDMKRTGSEIKAIDKYQ